jgi:hypothetical protein
MHNLFDGKPTQTVSYTAISASINLFSAMTEDEKFIHHALIKFNITKRQYKRAGRLPLKPKPSKTAAYVISRDQIHD